MLSKLQIKNFHEPIHCSVYNWKGNFIQMNSTSIRCWNQNHHSNVGLHRLILVNINRNQTIRLSKIGHSVQIPYHKNRYAVIRRWNNVFLSIIHSYIFFILPFGQDRIRLQIILLFFFFDLIRISDYWHHRHRQIFANFYSLNR